MWILVCLCSCKLSEPQSPSLQNGKSLMEAYGNVCLESPPPAHSLARTQLPPPEAVLGRQEASPRGQQGLSCRLGLTMCFPDTIPRNAAPLPCQPASLAATPPSYPEEPQAATRSEAMDEAWSLTQTQQTCGIVLPSCKDQPGQSQS